MYHVNLLGTKNGIAVNDCQRINCVSRALNPYTQNDAFLALAEQPEMRFVISNTTEAGIAFDPVCKLEDKPAATYPAKLTQLSTGVIRFSTGIPNGALSSYPVNLSSAMDTTCKNVSTSISTSGKTR